MNEPGGHAQNIPKAEPERDIADLGNRGLRQQFFQVAFHDGQNGANKNRHDRQWQQNKFKDQEDHVIQPVKDREGDPGQHIDRCLSGHRRQHG